jgi:hypothetical protein
MPWTSFWYLKIPKPARTPTSTVARKLTVSTLDFWALRLLKGWTVFLSIEKNIPLASHLCHLSSFSRISLKTSNAVPVALNVQRSYVFHSTFLLYVVGWRSPVNASSISPRKTFDLRTTIAWRRFLLRLSFNWKWMFLGGEYERELEDALTTSYFSRKMAKKCVQKMLE